MRKIAIIDDDHNSLEGMREVIPWHMLDCQWIGEARDGQEGLELIRRASPDIVITDIYMPVIDGLEMIQQLKDDDFQGKIIILSGYSDFEYARKALRLQVDDYLSKPVTVDEIVTVLEKVIRSLDERNASKTTEEELRQNLDLHLKISVRHGKNTLHGGMDKFGIADTQASPLIKSDVISRSLQFSQELTDILSHQNSLSAEQMVPGYIKDLREKEVSIHWQIQSIAKGIWSVLSASLLMESETVSQLYHQQSVILNEIESVNSLEQLEALIINQMIPLYVKHSNMAEFKHKKTVECMVQYAKCSYSQDITLNDMSSKLFMSRNYLNRIFKQVMGETFKDYVIRLRMEKAKALILEGDLLIYEIAEKVGYKNIPYFSTIFKKYFGVNPSDI